MPSIVRLALCCILFAGCDGMGSGVIVTGQGQFLANTPANQRTRIILGMQHDIDDQLDGTWRCLIGINELPVYNNDPDSMAEAWIWPSATIQIELVGMSKTSPNPQDQVSAAIRAYMRRHVDRPGRNLSIKVIAEVDAKRFAVVKAHPGLAPFASPMEQAAPSTSSAPVASTPAAVPPKVTAPPLPQHYTVQAGDTLVDISMAFYGTNQNWRLLIDANPGLTGANLHAGQQLVIPPKP